MWAECQLRATPTGIPYHKALEAPVKYPKHNFLHWGKPPGPNPSIRMLQKAQSGRDCRSACTDRNRGCGKKVAGRLHSLHACQLMRRSLVELRRGRQRLTAICRKIFFRPPQSSIATAIIAQVTRLASCRVRRTSDRFLVSTLPGHLLNEIWLPGKVPCIATGQPPGTNPRRHTNHCTHIQKAVPCLTVDRDPLKYKSLRSCIHALVA